MIWRFTDDIGLSISYLFRFILGNFINVALVSECCDHGHKCYVDYFGSSGLTDLLSADKVQTLTRKFTATFSDKSYKLYLRLDIIAYVLFF